MEKTLPEFVDDLAAAVEDNDEDAAKTALLGGLRRLCVLVEAFFEPVDDGLQGG